jgi:hypothetical protein
MHLDNDWYGHRRVLSEYCGVDNRPAFATILHGWIWNLGPDRGHRRVTSAPYLLWNHRHLMQGRRNGIVNVDAIGAPFAYLSQLRRGTIHHPEGTVLFPQHRTDYVSFETDHNDLIAAIEKRFPSPYTVSIFYSEPKFKEIATLYKGAGWQVFCAGTRSSAEFLQNMYGCLASHSHTVSNDFSSAIFYSAFLGRTVCILKDHLWPNSLVHQLPDDSGLVRLAGALFEGVAGSDAEAIGSGELGAELMLTPQELKRCLGWASPLKSIAAYVGGRLVDAKYGIGFRRGDKDL